MSIPYSGYSTDELLEELEQAGGLPDPDLIRTCLDRRDEVTPGLLDLVERSLHQEAEEATWAENDPHWYRNIHAALFLIAFGEEAALPLFDEHLRREKDDVLIESFIDKLHFFGPAAIPMLSALLTDNDVPVWTRMAVAGELHWIARAHPTERLRIVSIFRSLLPEVNEEGLLLDVDAAGEDQIRLWSDLAYDLAWLHDEESRPVVEALFDHDLIDSYLMEDVGEYHDILEVSERFNATNSAPEVYDIVEDYEGTLHRAGVATAPPGGREPVWGQMESDEGRHTAADTFIRGERKVGRNDSCPCGSGRKYKHCCGR